MTPTPTFTTPPGMGEQPAPDAPAAPDATASPCPALVAVLLEQCRAINARRARESAAKAAGEATA